MNSVTPKNVSNQFAVGFMSLVAILSLLAAASHLRPPPKVTSDAPDDVFSSGRAMEHLREIARKPHPVGSQEHERVRRYILDQLEEMGLRPEVQTTTVVRTPSETYMRGVTVRNIVARLAGRGRNGKAILLAAHYDTVRSSPGAGDDSAAVATLLETLRCLQAGPVPENDVIFLFSDAEEWRLLGAKAFVEEHPWMDDVGVVLNFEARGTRGPVVMFETSEGNEWLIDQLGQAVPHPFAFSYSTEVYKRMGNLTDLTELKERAPGLNFAFIHDPAEYHTAEDSVEEIDERSVQHQGSYAVSLVRQLGGADLEQARTNDNAVYFSVSGPIFVHYSVSWALPLAVLGLLLWGAAVAIGLRGGRLRWRGLVLGFSVALLLLVLAAAVAWLVQGAVSALEIWRAVGSGSGGGVLLGLGLLVIAVASWLYGRARGKLSLDDLGAGGLFLWLLLTIATSLLVPAASYLFVWPTLAGCLGLALLLKRQEKGISSVGLLLALAAALAVAILLFLPTLAMIAAALRLGSGPVVAVVVALLWILWLPQIELTFGTRQRLIVPGVALLLGVGLILAPLVEASFEDSSRRRNGVFYILDLDTGKAIWASRDDEPDEWTSQFITGNPRKEDLFPHLRRESTILVADASPIAATAPIARLEDVQDGEEGRRLRLRVASPSQAAILRIELESTAAIRSVCLDGECDQGGEWKSDEEALTTWSVLCVGPPPEGLEVVIEMTQSQPVEVTLIDQFYLLPETADISWRPRGNGVIPRSGWLTDSTYVRKTYTFGAGTADEVADGEAGP